MWRAAGRHQLTPCKVAASGSCKRTVWACDPRKNEPASVRRSSWAKPLLVVRLFHPEFIADTKAEEEEDRAPDDCLSSGKDFESCRQTNLQG